MGIVLVLSECVVDKFGEDPETGKLGGNGFFVAKALAALCGRYGANTPGSHDVYYIAPLSNDSYGKRFYAELEASGVNLGFAERTDTASLEIEVRLDQAGQPSYRFTGQQTPKYRSSEEHLDRVLKDLIPALREKKGEVILYCGSLSSVLPPGSDNILKFAQEAKKAGVNIFYDLNTRLQVVPELQGGFGLKIYQERVAAWSKVATVMKASLEDLAATYPERVALAEQSLEPLYPVADLWHESGAKFSIFTRGEKGVCMVDKYTGQSVNSRTQRLEVKNAVGAGDHCNAGMLAALLSSSLLSDPFLPNRRSAMLSCVDAGVSAAVQHLVAQGASAPVPSVESIEPSRQVRDSQRGLSMNR